MHKITKGSRKSKKNPVRQTKRLIIKKHLIQSRKGASRSRNPNPKPSPNPSPAYIQKHPRAFAFRVKGGCYNGGGCYLKRDNRKKKKKKKE